MKINNKIRNFINFIKTVILFIPKNGKLRLYINYKSLNKITIKNCYFFPLISELLNKIAGFKVFSKIDLKDTYYQI